MINVTYTCDACGVVKPEDDSEWMAIKRLGRGTILPRIEIRHFMDSGSDDAHLCGYKCLAAKVAIFVDETQERAIEVAADRVADVIDVEFKEVDEA